MSRSADRRRRNPFYRVAVALALLSGANASPSGALTPRIRNGDPTFDFPAVALMSAGGTSICTATLIACDTILTAAHCVCPDQASDTYAHCAAAAYPPEELLFFFQHAGLFTGKTMTIDPDFEFTRGGDLALIQLTEPVTGIAPQEVNTNRRPAEGSEATIVGFGRDEEPAAFVPPGVGVKRIATVETSQCPQSIRRSTHVCDAVGAGASAACPGDSGGPLFVDFAGDTLLAGVQSGINGIGGIFCQPPFTGFATDVFVHRSFLRDAVSDARPCGDLPAVGSAAVTVHPFLGQLSATTRELRGSFVLPAGAQLLRVTMNAVLATDRGRNNFDLFVKRGIPPNTDDFDCASTLPSALGMCEVVVPAAGTWHILAQQLAGQGQVQVTASVFRDPNAPSPTPTPTATPTPTPRPFPTGPVTDCVGDCNDDRAVASAEIVRGVSIALGVAAIDTCRAMDTDHDTTVAIGELLNAVEAGLRGCVQ